MGTRRQNPEQVIRKLLEISEPTWLRWVAQYGGMKADDAKRLKELARENARLKKIGRSAPRY